MEKVISLQTIWRVVFYLNLMEKKALRANGLTCIESKSFFYYFR